MPLERLLLYLTGAFVLACLGVGLLLVTAGKPDGPRAPTEAASAPPPPPPQEAPTPRQRLEASIAAAPDYAPFLDRLRENFPAEYRSAVDEFATRQGGPAVGGEATVDAFVSEAVRKLRKARGVAAARAEPGPLSKIFEAQRAVLHAIGERDPRLCVAFLYGGAEMSEFSRFAATRRALVADMALAGLEAIVNGGAKQIERPGPTEADFKALETALAARGLSQEVIGALLDGKMPDPPLEDAKMCAAGETYLETLRSLPEPARLRIYGLAVEVMARS
ncbi:MAG TPA: hypothetical protein VK446_11590 [Methylocystis sp.]|nr:hypothetical protein [Methylocystis sp.]